MPSRSPADLQRERKKKNAEAQSQFRQRRANYISSLEETVTKLEAVVLELQDALRESKTENDQFSDERRQLMALTDQLRQDQRIREHEWKAAWTAKLPGIAFPGSAIHLPPPAQLSVEPSSSRASHLPTCLDPSLKYGLNLKDRPQLPRNFEESAHFAFNSNPGPNSSRPPSASPYNSGPVAEGLFFRPMEDGTGTMALPGSSTSFRRGIPSNFDLSQSHQFSESSSNGLPFLPRMPHSYSHDAEIPSPLGHDSRSMSPHSPHASPSSASTSASSHIYQLPELPSLNSDPLGSMKPYGAVSLGEHVQLPPFPPGEGNSASVRRPDPTRRTTFPTLASFPASIMHPQLQTSALGARPESPNAMEDRYADQMLPSHLSTNIPRHRSFTISPSSEQSPIVEVKRRSTSPPISNTLAVIKAQAFGALRRNRTHRKRGNGYATKVALEALQARGLGLGLEPTNTLSSLADGPMDNFDEDQRDLSDNELMMEQ